jgi:hypothetical protein
MVSSLFEVMAYKIKSVVGILEDIYSTTHHVSTRHSAGPFCVGLTGR